MMVPLPEVLTPDQVRQCRQALETADWSDGCATAGHQAMRVKDNQQLSADSAVARQIGERILDALGRNAQFIASALPLRVLPPRFNRYTGGGQYGHHVDSAILAVPNTPHRMRTDISATLFFSEPEDYDGGELVIEDTCGARSVKLPAGHLLLYPGTSVHRVTPVTRGTRYAAFFWIQSLVRDDGRRSLLLDLDTAIQRLTLQLPDSAEIPRLTGVYHNLLRQWSDT